MRDLDITSLRLFAAVCDARSIARAAEAEHIVPSAISKRLSQLEDAVGTPLLERRGRGVAPTAAGQTLLEHTRDVLAAMARIGRDMAGYAGGMQGHIRLLATASVLAESLADDVADFLRLPGHRNIRIDIEERVSTEVVRGVREGSASLGICWDAANFDGLHTRRYRSDHLAVAVHASHPLAGQGPLRFVDTLAYEHVGLPLASAVLLMLQREAALAGQPLVYRMLVSNFEAALRAVRANLAISVVPAEAAQMTAEAYGLRIVPLQDTWARRRFAICLRDPVALPPAALVLLAHLEAAAEAQAPPAAPA